MVLVGLPETPVTKKYQEALTPDDQYDHVMIKEIRDQYCVYATISHVMGKLWCRLSVQVYNCKDDYCSLRDAVLGITNMK